MFTGIIEAVGTLAALEPRGSHSGENGFGVVIEAPAVIAGVRVGDSIAVNGACLTVTKIDAGRLHFDAVRETLERTSLGDQRVGARMNLERAMRADGRLDGHIVQGHVDGTGRVDKLAREGDDVRFCVSCGPEIARFLVEKGSVAIDGVSLTVVGVSERGFDVALIPHTLKETNLGDRRPGDRVNLEADVLGKVVERLVAGRLP